MFSAKKIDGKKLYQLARKGQTIEREPCRVHLEIELIDYTYPHIDLTIACSKGTYVRSIAHDLGQLLGCGAYLQELRRSRSGTFTLESCVDGTRLDEHGFNPLPYLLTYDRLNLTK